MCRDIELVPELTYYFGLFIIETVMMDCRHRTRPPHPAQEGGLSGRIVRKLQSFECPFKALQLSKRKSILQVCGAVPCGWSCHSRAVP